MIYRGYMYKIKERLPFVGKVSFTYQILDANGGSLGLGPSQPYANATDAIAFAKDFIDEHLATGEQEGA